jgi:hypothetical protein
MMNRKTTNQSNIIPRHDVEEGMTSVGAGSARPPSAWWLSGVEANEEKEFQTTDIY